MARKGKKSLGRIGAAEAREEFTIANSNSNRAAAEKLHRVLRANLNRTREPILRARLAAALDRVRP
jgi:hypothetical protein